VGHNYPQLSSRTGTVRREKKKPWAPVAATHGNYVNIRQGALRQGKTEGIVPSGFFRM
jgi:hypothetical protein